MSVVRRAIFGAVGMALAVAFGAFGAHGLEGRVDSDSLEWWQTAVRYQAWHSIGILVLSALDIHNQSPWTWRAQLMLIVGVVLFSGSLYLLVLTGTKAFGAITPFGGLAFIVGWSFAIVALLGMERVPNDVSDEERGAP